MFYGLAAALGWGLADLSAAVCGRRIGSFMTLALAQIAGLVLLLVFWPLLQLQLHVTPTAVALLVANGVMSSVAYIALYRALELGPVALVSPIVAAYAAISVILAVTFMHESVRGMVLVGMLVTLAGVVLTSTDMKVLRSAGFSLEKGVRLALLAMLLFGLATFVVAHYSRTLQWYAPVLFARVGNTASVLAVAWFFRLRVQARPEPRNILLAAAVGAADVLGLIFYARGTQAGSVSVVSAASASFILIPVLGGLILFRERPALNQAIGVAFVGLGLVLLGLGAPA